MPAKQRRRRPAGQAVPRRTQGQARRPAPNRPVKNDPYRTPGQYTEGIRFESRSPGQRVEDSFFYEHPPRRDNTVQFPTGGRARPPRSDSRRPQTARPARDRRPQAARPARPAPPRQEARRRRRVTRKMLRRRRMMRRLTAAFLVLCVAGAGIYLTMTMLFKINAIRVAGPDGADIAQAGPYTSSQILDALGVQVEENIFSFDPEAKAAQLEKEFPLLEQIQVQRVYPSTVVVQVTPAAPAYAMQTPTGWISLSAGLKILAAEPVQPEGLPVLYGGDPVSVTPGDQLAYAAPPEGEASSQAADSRMRALETLLGVLEEHGLLEDVTRIEYADVEQLAFLYQDRISVLLGTLNELDYKMDYAEYMLLNKEGKGCAETDTGQLDCSHVRTDGTLQAIFAQGTPDLPSGYLPPEQTAAAAPEDGAEAASGQPQDGQPDTAGQEAGQEGTDAPLEGTTNEE